MPLPSYFEQVTNPNFRLLAGYTSPPRVGQVTAIEANGQVRVSLDDPDGGDALAWPLDGFVYAIDDIVYVLFAADHPESAIVLGSRSPQPALDPLITETIKARDTDGIKIQTSSGTDAIILDDTTGNTGFGGAPDPTRRVHVKATGQASMVMQTTDDTVASFGAVIATTNGFDVVAQLIAHDTVRTVSRYGLTLGGWAELLNSGAGLAGLALGTQTNSPIVMGTNDNERARITGAGDIGIGTTSPQGRFHVHDGTGGLLFATKTGITGTAQTIIPNAAGDVTLGVVGYHVTAAGATVSAGTLGPLVPGGSQNVVIGANTYQ